MIRLLKEIYLLRILLPVLFVAYFCLVQAEVVYSQGSVMPPPPPPQTPLHQLPQQKLDFPTPQKSTLEPPTKPIFTPPTPIPKATTKP